MFCGDERLDAARRAHEQHHDDDAAEHEKPVKQARADRAEPQQSGDRQLPANAAPNTSAPMRMAALTTVSTFCQRMRRGRCVVVVFKAPHFARNWRLIQGAPPGDARRRRPAHRRMT